MKKVVLINLIVIVVIAGFFETVARLYDRWEIKALPRVPDNAEGFGDFQGYSHYLAKLNTVEDDMTGGNINIYEPFTAIGLRPNYEIKINNYDYHINSLGFRSKELIEPKPPEVFRVFILGGSTVEGGLNRLLRVLVLFGAMIFPGFSQKLGGPLTSIVSIIPPWDLKLSRRGLPR